MRRRRRASVLPPGFLEAVERRVGARGWSIDPERIGPHAAEPWGTARGHSPLLLRPATTAEVAAVLELCHGAGVPVVPQGGNTGLVGAGVPDRSGRLAVLSLGRLNRIRALDPLNDTITVEAGCVLETVQQAAAEVNRLFPLALGAQGSCQIGGNLSTNAGGINVLRYGMARALVLGLEVVLADGRIWDGLRVLAQGQHRLRPEAAVHRRRRHARRDHRGRAAAAAAAARAPDRLARRCPRPQAAVALLGLVRERLGETVSSFELLAGGCVELVLRYLPGARAPLARPAPWYVLAEVAWSLEGGLGAELERVLEDALARGLITDGVIAKSEAERRALWALRENPTEAMAHEGLVLRHDIAVPVSRVPDLIEQGAAALAAAVPGVRIMPFGHLGDGNIHYNLLQPAGMAADAFRARAEQVQGLVFDVVAGLGGSISAEHGIGRLKRAELAARKSAARARADARAQGRARPQGHPEPRRGALTPTLRRPDDGETAMTATRRRSTTSASSSSTWPTSRGSAACRASRRRPPTWSTRSSRRPAGSRSTSSLPLNAAGDRQRARLENGVVRTPDGFKEAYRKFVEGGWHGLQLPTEWGGQGLPWTVATAVWEMWNSANLVVLPLPDPDPGRRRAAAPARHRGAAPALSAQARERRVDRHHVPDRAAGRLRRRRAPDPGGARGRPLPDPRHQDLHHLRRARPTPRTRSTWCSRAPRARPPARAASRCS